MLDSSKLSAMNEADYKIVDSCMTCSWGPMQPFPFNGWGQCSRHFYKRDEHDEKQPMPSHVSFICKNHRRSPWVDRALGEYAVEPWKEQ